MSKLPQGLPLCLTMGDPAGIGPDITLQAWQQRHMRRTPCFFALADKTILEDRALALGLDIPIENISSPKEAAGVFDRALPVMALENDGETVSVIAGQPSSSAAKLIISSITRGVELALAGDVAGLVTNPIAKHVLYDAGFKHPGHTEFLEYLARERGLDAASVMMLSAGNLRTVPLTIHIPLKDVARTISRSLIVKQCLIIAHEFQQYFTKETPRIAIVGLNPHAGENGTLGTEENTIITPAIEELREEGMNVTGPLPADTVFHEEARSDYDVIVCMYHDQALIPVKMLGFHEGVNTTLGLPFIRTSPDHGTAFTLAGSGRSNPSSLISALKHAAAMAASAS